MATVSTHLQSGEAGLDMAHDGSTPETVQLAAATGDATEIQLPQGDGRQVVVIPVNPGETIALPTGSPGGLLAKLGADGNLAIVIDGRTIILKGYAEANETAPIKVVTNDGDVVDVTDVLAGTLPNLDIQTAAGPDSGPNAAGSQGDAVQGSGIFVAFAAGPLLPGLLAEGVLDPTDLGYKLIDDEQRFFPRDEEDTDTGLVGFTTASGNVNEDDLVGRDNNQASKAQFLPLFAGNGNDPFDGKDIDDGDDGFPDSDREPLTVTVNLNVDFGGTVPGKLSLDASLLPTGLTSRGEPITYEIQPGGGGAGPVLVGFVDDGDGKAGPGDHVIFTAQVAEESSNGAFTLAFLLFDKFDNEAPGSLLGANEQDLMLPIKVIAEDSNGTQLDGTWNVGVRDDIPFFGEMAQDGGLFFVPSPGTIVLDETRGGDLDADDKPGAPYNGEAVLVINSYLPQFVQRAQDAAEAGITLDPTVLPKLEAMAERFANSGGIAAKQLLVSFGADGGSQEFLKNQDDPSARDSVHGALSGSGENERPFELFMVKPGTTGTPTDGDVTTAIQATNATAIWDGVEYPILLEQFNAQVIVGYIEPTGDAAGHMLPAFVLQMLDDGQVLFVQTLPFGHAIDGPTPEDHDDSITILGADGVTQLIHVRATDYDGDHATLPLTITIQDDGPVHLSTDFDTGNIISEDDLTDSGSAEQLAAVANGLSATGNIEFDFGVDGAGGLSIGALTITDGADQSIDLKDLRTADGHQITIAESVDATTGVITWEGVIKDGPDAGQKAFTFTLDGSGDNIGDFAFTLHAALEHPFTGEESEDNLFLNFNVIATDADGDTTESTVAIGMEDESEPTAALAARRSLNPADLFDDGNENEGDGPDQPSDTGTPPVDPMQSMIPVPYNPGTGGDPLTDADPGAATL